MSCNTNIIDDEYLFHRFLFFSLAASVVSNDERYEFLAGTYKYPLKCSFFFFGFLAVTDSNLM